MMGEPMTTRAPRTERKPRAGVAWLVACLLSLSALLASCIGPGLEPPAHDRGVPDPVSPGHGASSGASGGGRGGASGQPAMRPPASGAADAGAPDPMDSDEDGGSR
jgi:hypothetical protein